MYVIGMIKKALGITDLESRVDKLEGILPALDGRIDKLVSNLGDYKNKTKKELKILSEELDHALGSISKHSDAIDDLGLTKRKKSLIRKILNNRTRVRNAFNSYK